MHVRGLIFALMILLSAVPALALESDIESAKIMTRCAVFMDEAALLADHDKATQEAETNRQVASAFKLAAAYYTPGEPEEAGTLIRSWTAEYRIELDTVDEATMETQMKACDGVHDKVQAALDDYSKQASEN